MNDKCKVCGNEIKKTTIQPILRYCIYCDKVYKTMPVDVKPIVDLAYKAIGKDNGDGGKEAWGRYEALRAMIDALEKGNLTKLEKLAGVTNG